MKSEDDCAINVVRLTITNRIAEKPKNIRIFYGGGLKYGNCPICGGGINSEYSWCFNCGQVIDWSEEKQKSETEIPIKISTKLE